MKKLLLLLLVMLMHLPAMAEIFTKNDIEYQSSSDSTCYVRGGEAAKGRVIIPEIVTSYTNKSYKVDYINRNAFKGNSKITSVDIPITVYGIGDYAFQNCTGLTMVYIRDGVEEIGNACFESCTNLETLHVGTSLKSLGRRAFSSCVSLTFFETSETVRTIGEGAFSYCTALKNVYFHKGLETIEKEAFYNCTALSSNIYFPDGIKIIGDYAFSGCKNIEWIKFHGKTIEKIGNGAFESCDNLKSADLPLTVKDFGGSIFWGCTSLTSFRLPENISELNSTFAGCTSLQTVTVPSNIETLNLAFSGCSGLTKVNLPNTLRRIIGAFNRCSNLSAINIPDSVKVLEPYISWRQNENHVFVQVDTIGAFEGCKSLRDIPMSNYLSDIGEQAFNGCSGLTSINIPGNIRTISAGAFSDCESLKEVIMAHSISQYHLYVYDGCFHNSPVKTLNIDRYWSYNKRDAVGTIRRINDSMLKTLTEVHLGESLTYIPEYAFKDCKDLKEISLNNRVTLICAYAFSGCSSLQNVNIEDVKNENENETYIPYLDINKCAFNDCVNIKELIIPSRIQEIGERAFNGCSGLAKLTIANRTAQIYNATSYPQNLEIGDSAFYACSSLAEVTLPDYNSKIGDHAFANCSTINKISTLGTCAASISKNTFSGLYDKVPLTVPDGSAMNYLAAEWWPQFFNINEESGARKISSHDDGVFKYRLISGDENQAILVSPKSMTNTAVSVPRRVAVESMGDATFYKVTHIRRNAFQNYTAMEKLVLPTSLVEVGDSSFYNCSSLKELAFKEGLENIGANAFASCKSLTGVSLPSTLKKIGQKAFEGDSILAKTEFPDIARWCDVEFSDSLSNPVYYSRNLHVGGALMENLKIPSGVKRIRDYAFTRCHSIKSLELPNTLESVKSYAFYDCRNIPSLTIPESVDTVGECAFKNCLILDILKIADSRKQISILSNSFENAPLKELYIGRNFGEYWYSNRQFTGGDTENIYIGNLVTTIPYCAFENVTTLKNVMIGSGVTRIGTGAFEGCSLTEVVVPSSVEVIDNSAFSNNQLETLIIGEGIKSAGAKAFEGNDKLEKVCVTAPTPPSAQNDTFSYYGGSLLVTPGHEADYEDYPRCWYRFSDFGLIDSLVEAESVDVDKKEVSAAPGEQFQLTATISPENATLKKILWRSTNPDIATVDHNGLVTMVVPKEKEQSRAPLKEEADCEIHAYTLYSESPVAICRINATFTGVNVIKVDNGYISDGNFSEDMPVEVYNLNGLRVSDSTENLAPGIYIVRQGAKSRKISVR